MTELKENETLEDLLIDGLKIIQSKDLYRFSSDAVLLSKFASFKKGDKVIDLCAGSGIVGLHFYALHKDLKSVKEVEIQPELTDLCRRSVEYNGLQSVFTVDNIPLQELPTGENGRYSLVLCNPPYKKAGSGETNPIKSVAIARHELTGNTSTQTTAVTPKSGCKVTTFSLISQIFRYFLSISSQFFCFLYYCH